MSWEVIAAIWTVGWLLGVIHNRVYEKTPWPWYLWLGPPGTFCMLMAGSPARQRWMLDNGAVLAWVIVGILSVILWTRVVLHIRQQRNQSRSDSPS